MRTSAIFCALGPQDPELHRVLSPRLRVLIAAQSVLVPEVVTPENFAVLAPQLRDVEVIFATWGMWELTPDQLAALPNLKAVFYAAGTVKYFARPLLERGIVVTSSWQANAVPVAEFTLAQILLANKGYWRNVVEYRKREDYGAFRGCGNMGARVSLLGAGQIGRRVIELLRPFQLEVAVYDPFLTVKSAEQLGVEKIDSLAHAFERGQVVSNHLAAVPETFRLIRGAHLDLMPRHATFINTGRGSTVCHDELLEVLSKRSDLMALLDVTDPEPLPSSHPLRTLPNAYISSHIAGSIGDEVERMGQVAVEEFQRWTHGDTLLYAVRLEMLDRMA